LHIDQHTGDAVATLERMVDEVSTFDPKDQAEILAAWSVIQDRRDSGGASEWAAVRDRLKVLPSSVEVLMRRLGTMPTSDR
jgi:hypothetical protein